jgi:hypothetical protein
MSDLAGVFVEAQVLGVDVYQSCRPCKVMISSLSMKAKGKKKKKASKEEVYIVLTSPPIRYKPEAALKLCNSRPGSIV